MQILLVLEVVVETWFGLDAVGGALGLMLIDVVLCRLGIVQGDRDDAYYRRLAGWGLAVGAAVTVVEIVIRSLSDWSPDVAMLGHIPTGVGTIPMVLGYLAVIDLTRTMIAVWILGVWALQLWWSTAWLQRSRYGPFEWAWRTATYRWRQPLRRSRTAIT